MKYKNNEKGITLIALLVSIIILIILAGVAVLNFNGNTNLVNSAQEAKFSTTLSEFKEKIELAHATALTDMISNRLTNPNYQSTSSENFNEITNNIAKTIGVEQTKISYLGSNIKVAQNEGNIGTLLSDLGDMKNVSKEGYTVVGFLDTPASDEASGEGFIAIWYSTSSMRGSINGDTERIKDQYNLAELSSEENEEYALVSVIHVDNNNMEIEGFENDKTKTVGLTSIEKAKDDANNTSKKFAKTSLNNGVTKFNRPKEDERIKNIATEKIKNINVGVQRSKKIAITNTNGEVIEVAPKWESLSTDIVTVDQEGNITGVSLGEGNVIAVSQDDESEVYTLYKVKVMNDLVVYNGGKFPKTTLKEKTSGGASISSNDNSTCATITNNYSWNQAHFFIEAKDLGLESLKDYTGASWNFECTDYWGYHLDFVGGDLTSIYIDGDNGMKGNREWYSIIRSAGDYHSSVSRTTQTGIGNGQNNCNLLRVQFCTHSYSATMKIYNITLIP